MQIFRKLLSFLSPARHRINCKELLLKLSDFVDGELDSSLCKEMEKHLIDCRRCKVFVDTFKKTITILKHRGEEELPEEVHIKLHDFLKERCKKS